MTRYVVIWSLMRGIVEPHEPLDPAGQYLANLEAQKCDEDDSRVLRRRATFGYQLERDPMM
jgi:hypothetical protein